MEQGPRAFHAMTNPNCPICLGIGFVYESHPDRAWSAELRCQCGAGDPCNGAKQSLLTAYLEPAETW